MTKSKMKFCFAAIDFMFRLEAAVLSMYDILVDIRL